MKIYTSREEVRREVIRLKSEGKSIGFVPTMGALHKGHLSLVSAALSSCDIVVSSIFVNPTQFTDQTDLENYPRPIDSDLKQLAAAGCHIAFTPSVDEMYDSSEAWRLNLNGLDEVLEGAIRPGHYQGVTQIVSKLFDTVMPDRAFFGQKDYQQVMVIRHMVDILNIPVVIEICPIVREADGLAMSSRNIHLNNADRKNALALYHTLSRAKEQKGLESLESIQSEGLKVLSESEGIIPEYFVLYDADKFVPASEHSAKIIALAAAQVGSIRIIDNMYLN